MAGPTINSKQINGQVQTATEHTIPRKAINTNNGVAANTGHSIPRKQITPRAATENNSQAAASMSYVSAHYTQVMNSISPAAQDASIQPMVYLAEPDDFLAATETNHMQSDNLTDTQESKKLFYQSLPTRFESKQDLDLIKKYYGQNVQVNSYTNGTKVSLEPYGELVGHPDGGMFPSGRNLHYVVSPGEATVVRNNSPAHGTIIFANNTNDFVKVEANIYKVILPRENIATALLTGSQTKNREIHVITATNRQNEVIGQYVGREYFGKYKHEMKFATENMMPFNPIKGADIQGLRPKNLPGYLLSKLSL